MISFIDTDAAFVLLNDEGKPVTIRGSGTDGGPIDATVGTITPEALVRVLNRFGPIAQHTGLSIPEQHLELADGRTFHVRSVFKVTPECFDEHGRWAQDVSCRVVSKKRYVLSRVGPSGDRISAKASAHVIGNLANFRTDGALDEERIDEAWRIAPAVGANEPIGSALLDLTEPVLQPFTPATTRDWRALRKLRFSSKNPGGDRPFETLLVPLPLGRSRQRLVAHLEPDRTRWAHLEFRDPDGDPWSIRTPSQVGRFTAMDGRVQVVPDLGMWLRGYMHAPEPLALGPDGEPCTERTVGPLTRMPVRIVSRRFGGQEPHRRRDEEAVLGWNVKRAQAEVGRTCQYRGCGTELTGRQRRWCGRHRRYPGTRRKAAIG